MENKYKGNGVGPIRQKQPGNSVWITLTISSGELLRLLPTQLLPAPVVYTCQWNEEGGFKDGGMHYLVNFTDEPGLFWGMAIYC